MPVQSKMTTGSSASLALAGAAGAIALTSQSPSSFVAPSSASSHGHSSQPGAANIDRPASTSSASAHFGASSLATASAAAGAVALLAGMNRMKSRGRVSKGEEARMARMAKKASARDSVLAGSATYHKPRNMWPVAAAAAVAEVLPKTEIAAEVEGAPAEPVAPPPFDPAVQVGAVEPLGFFDPLGFTQVGDEKGFNKLRAAEIKHGRVAMMASIGAIAQPFLRLPMFDFPNASGTFGALANGRVTFGLFVLFVASGIMELVWREEEGREPGNFGDPFGVDMYTEEMRTKEINNGRMAMISVFGIFAAEVVTGKNAIEQLTLFAGTATAEATVTEIAAEVEGAPEEPVAPPPFDPAVQVGAVEPLGFFDPLGFTQVGDEKGFNKLRAAEIKHGRVAMMASIGAIAQPFLRLPMFDFPNASGTFGALANGRVTFGLFVLFVASGIMELVWREEEGREPGNFGDPFGVDMYTEEMRTKEINNGRMAMISVFGIFAAEVVTGKNAIEQLTLFADVSKTH